MIEDTTTESFDIIEEMTSQDLYNLALDNTNIIQVRIIYRLLKDRWEHDYIYYLAINNFEYDKQINIT